jgi:hypothetical protein
MEDDGYYCSRFLWLGRSREAESRSPSGGLDERAHAPEASPGSVVGGWPDQVVQIQIHLRARSELTARAHFRRT